MPLRPSLIRIVRVEESRNLPLHRSMVTKVMGRNLTNGTVAKGPDVS